MACAEEGFLCQAHTVASWGSCTAPGPGSVLLGSVHVPSAAAIALFSPVEQQELVGRLDGARWLLVRSQITRTV